MDTFIAIGDKVLLRDGRVETVDSVSFGWVEGYEDKAENIVRLSNGEFLPASEIVSLANEALANPA